MAIVSDLYSNIKDYILLYIRIYIDFIVSLNLPVISLMKDFNVEF